MHPKRIPLAGAIVSIVACAFFAFDLDQVAREENAPPVQPESASSRSPRAEAAEWRAPPSNASISPFGMAQTQAEDPSHRIASRRSRMEAWKYSTPPEYFSMGLAQLTKLAKAGDAFALIQLGEQYSTEIDSIQGDPGFDPKADPDQLARESFTAAIHAGHTEIAAVMAMKALDKNDVVDAAAWQMVTRSHQHPNASMLDQHASRFKELNPEQKTAAMNKYRTIIERLSERPPGVELSPLFYAAQ